MSEASLKDLFKRADEVGDKYLTAEEIEKRDKELAEIRAEILKLLAE